MTETWAGLLREEADHADAVDDSPPIAAKLRRLASLLEQITPEWIEWAINDAGCPRCGGGEWKMSNPPTCTGCGLRPSTAHTLLYALATDAPTAPTEETEDR